MRESERTDPLVSPVFRTLHFTFGKVNELTCKWELKLVVTSKASKEQKKIIISSFQKVCQRHGSDGGRQPQTLQKLKSPSDITVCED